MLTHLVKYITYCNFKLYLANENTVRVYQLPAEEELDGTEDCIDLSTVIMRKVECSLRIVAMFINIHCQRTDHVLLTFELPDSQIDTNRLFIEEIEDNENWSYYFEQYRRI